MGSVKAYDSGVYLVSLTSNLSSFDEDRILKLSHSEYLRDALAILVSNRESPSINYPLFTSINKPSGSYIGDGSVGREIEVSNGVYATGNVMIITCEENNTLVIVTPNGSFVCDSGGVTFELTTQSVGFYGNSFIIWNVLSSTNSVGDTYEYFVL